MRDLIMCFVFCILLLSSNELRGTASDFEAVFGDGTLRVDLIHSGTSIDEEYAIRRVIKQSEWAGPTVNLVPTADMGKYRVDLYDNTTGILIYRHGFSSLFGEWQTTGEASTIRRAFEETLEFPYPKNSIDLEIFSRNEKGEMVRVFSAAIDPNSHLIGRSVTNPGVKVHEILLSGESSVKLDLLILGDGYTLTERVKFRND